MTEQQSTAPVANITPPEQFEITRLAKQWLEDLLQSGAVTVEPDRTVMVDAEHRHYAGSKADPDVKWRVTVFQPGHRGEEPTDKVAQGPDLASLVWDVVDYYHLGEKVARFEQQPQPEDVELDG